MQPHSATRHFAVIEIGTNSTKLVIARVAKDGSFESLRFSKKTTRIGADLTTSGRIGDNGVDRTLRVIRQFEEMTRRYPSCPLFIFATFAMRRATNGRDVAMRIEKQLKQQLRILSGSEEARFAYLSATRALHLKKPSTLLADIGGGSTEFVLATAGRVTRVRSLALGALHLTERFVHSDPVEMSEFAKLRGHVDRVIQKSFTATGVDRLFPSQFDLVLSGGSVTTALQMITAGVENRHDVVPRVASSDISMLLERCLTMPLSKRKRIPGLEPSRADIISAGIAVVLHFMRRTRKRVAYINKGGVREGVLAHILDNGFKWA